MERKIYHLSWQRLKDGNKVKIFVIDPHIGSSEHQKMFGEVDTFEEFKQNINKAGVAEYVEPIRDTSENAAKTFNQKIEFVFIDGAHEYNFVKLDFELWFPKVMNGGLLAFHDSWHFIGLNLATAIPLVTSSKIKIRIWLTPLHILKKSKETLYLIG